MQDGERERAAAGSRGFALPLALCPAASSALSLLSLHTSSPISHPVSLSLSFSHRAVIAHELDAVARVDSGGTEPALF